ncbi:MAG: outer membrane beta-barrel protein, partial [Bacteroidales bacterium]
DLWQDKHLSLQPKTLNPGVNIFGAYNFMLGESDFSFSPGIGLGVHNLYSESWLVTTQDEIYFLEIPDTIDYKKSKLTNSYLDIPLEFRFKSKGEFRVAIGFKYGFLMKSQTKYKGEGDAFNIAGSKVIVKQARFDHVENTRYGFVGRIGYKWLNVYGYYQLSSLFTEGKGQQMYPISIGITVIPF